MPWSKKETTFTRRRGRPDKQSSGGCWEPGESAKVGSLRENLTPVYRLKGWYHSLPWLSCVRAATGRPWASCQTLRRSGPDWGKRGVKRSTRYPSSPWASSSPAANHISVPKRSWEAHYTEHDERPKASLFSSLITAFTEVLRVHFMFALLLYRYLQISIKT